MKAECSMGTVQQACDDTPYRRPLGEKCGRGAEYKTKKQTETNSLLFMGKKKRSELVNLHN